MLRIDPSEDATELLRSLLEHSPHPVAFLDPQLRYVAHSQQWLEVFGLPDRSLLGRHHLDVLGEPIGPELLVQCLAGGDIRRKRVPFDQADGSRDWMDWTIAPRRGSSGEIVGLVLLVEVVTASVELEQRLEAATEFHTSRERALERARQVERLKAIQQSKLALLGEMAAGIAHEVNNPLQVIDACAYLLTELWSCAANEVEVTQQAVELLEDVRTATFRAGRIVDGLRRFARESDGQRDESISIPRLVEETLDLCRSRLQNHGVDLRVRVETDAVVRGNALELSQALLNLVINAFDAVKRSEQPFIALVARQVDHHVELSVEDTGSGVAPEHVGRIFEPFFTTKAVGEGTGLGLSITRGLVETMGGTLSMDDASERTRFVIRLPVEVVT